MDVFSALADPTRRQILCLLEAGPLEASEIAAHFAISKPAISKHLKRLREGRLVQRQVAAQRRIYRLDPAGLDEAAQWVADRRSAWAARLDGLEKLLDRGIDNADSAISQREETDHE